MRPRRSALRLLLLVALLPGAGCRAAVGLHWPVPPPPPLRAAAPELWVALAARLGPAPAPAGQTQAPPPLRLRAEAGTLTLVTPQGQRFMAPELVLHWRWQPLADPLLIRRRGLGPFASYESAEAVASRWRALGVRPLIAHPRDWEVWAPADAPAPAGLTPLLLERRLSQRLVLELRRSQGVVPLDSPLQLMAPQGLRWNGGVYGGPFRLQADAHGGWTLLEQVPLERYLAGVVPHEIGAGAPAAALAAQAVLARTWALRNRQRFAVDGYHLCADTQCQVYSDPRQAGPAVSQAIAATRLQVLTWQNRPIQAVYHASNGGVIAAYPEAWGGDSLPYLKPAADGPAPLRRLAPVPLPASALPALLAAGGQAWGADHPLFRWTRLLDADTITTALGPLAAGLGSVNTLQVVERGPSGRVTALLIRGSRGQLVLRRDAIRRQLRQLPSTLFLVERTGPGRWLLRGGGFGHGAGLSQAGAIDLARRGWDWPRILAHYYPGTQLQPIQTLDGAP